MGINATSPIIYICPTCSSGSITPPILVGADYTCSSCGWKGIDPFAAPLTGPFADSGSVDRFCNELLKAFASSAALPLGRILVTWGLVATDIKGKPNTKELARFIQAMAKAAAVAVINELAVMDHERVEELHGNSR